MNRIWHGRKNVIEKQEASSKYHLLVERCNSQHVSVSCLVKLVDFNKMNSVMSA